jgi:hypothetical protein
MGGAGARCHLLATVLWVTLHPTGWPDYILSQWWVCLLWLPTWRGTTLSLNAQRRVVLDNGDVAKIVLTAPTSMMMIICTASLSVLVQITMSLLMLDKKWNCNTYNEKCNRKNNLFCRLIVSDGDWNSKNASVIQNLQNEFRLKVSSLHATIKTGSQLRSTSISWGWE